MDTNMTFRMNAETKAQMNEICRQLGMTTSTAFNLFANAFVREKGMPFPVTVKKRETILNTEQVLEDTAKTLSAFSSDYKRMAE